jgi:hypothetical protein
MQVMLMSGVRIVLNALDKKTLIQITQQLNLTGWSVFNTKDEIITRLARKRTIDWDDVLSQFKMPDLKGICWKLGVNGGAISKQVLIDRILGKVKPTKRYDRKLCLGK